MSTCDNCFCKCDREPLTLCEDCDGVRESEQVRAALAEACGLLRAFADEENWQTCLWCNGTLKDRQDHKHRMRCGNCQGRGKTLFDDCADEVDGGMLGRARAFLAKNGGG